MSDISSCINCVHAAFQKTPTGRISRIVAGRCGWSITFAVPNCMSFDNKESGTMTLKPSRHIWYGDGKGCATFTPHPPRATP